MSLNEYLTSLEDRSKLGMNNFHLIKDEEKNDIIFIFMKTQEQIKRYLESEFPAPSNAPGYRDRPLLELLV